MKRPESPLDYLPEAMVNEMLQKHASVVEGLSNRLREIEQIKTTLREKLLELKLLRNVSGILGQKTYPTTAGVDGTYAAIRQLALDTVGIAGVAVEGLVPPHETRRWDIPHHIIRIFPVEHNPNTLSLCSALMFSFELELATSAPHRVVFLDGSLTTHLIKIGQGLMNLDKGPTVLKNEFAPRIVSTLENYIKILTSPRADIMYVGVPKYSSRDEIIKKLKENGVNYPILDSVDDKGLLSIVLRPGDVVGPIELGRKEDRWHLTLGEGRKDQPELQELRKKIIDALWKLHVLYFKVSPAHPALRLEVNENIARNDRMVAVLLEAVMDQSGIPGILEPYPLYIADMFVKYAYFALSELKEAALTDVVRVLGVPEDIFLALHDYRSEGGFE